jgi:hypothetical protein
MSLAFHLISKIKYLPGFGGEKEFRQQPILLRLLGRSLLQF